MKQRKEAFDAAQWQASCERIENGEIWPPQWFFQFVSVKAAVATEDLELSKENRNWHMPDGTTFCLGLCK